MTTFYDYFAVLDRVFQSGGKKSVTALAKEHGWGRARFVRVLDELQDADMVDMKIDGVGAVKSHKPFATRTGIVALLNFNRESSESIIEFLMFGMPVYAIDAPYHDYSGWKRRETRVLAAIDNQTDAIQV